MRVEDVGAAAVEEVRGRLLGGRSLRMYGRVYVFRES